MPEKLRASEWIPIQFPNDGSRILTRRDTLAGPSYALFRH